MPDRVLPTLVARRAVLDRAAQLTLETEYDGIQSIDGPMAQRHLDFAVAAARARYAAYSHWQGFTWADWQTRQALR